MVCQASPRIAEMAAPVGFAPRPGHQSSKFESICYVTGHCSLGFVLVAMTDRGVCAILLGDATAPLISDLHRRFAHAQCRVGDARGDHTLARVIALIERPDAAFPLPLDIRGTAFQLQVWQALRRLIPGTTASYAGIARQIGRPRATRAVARACAANPLAVVIPCHRVVRTDGGLGGYRWGIDRKRLLLNREAGP